MCGASALTEPTQVRGGDGSTRVVFSRASGGDDYEVALTRGRVCLACGHVVLSVNRNDLEKLNGDLAGLVVVRG
jgi:hypothetical protein